jgi:GNAT superfamily N-acetyltransferase
VHEELDACSLTQATAHRDQRRYGIVIFAYDGNVIIRLAKSSDLYHLMELVRRAVPLMRAAGNLQWDDAYPNEDIFARDIDLEELWVAEPAPGIIAGVAAITTDQSPEYVGVGWNIHEPAIVIHRLAVDPEYRGAGIASALLQRAEQVARDRGITRLLIDTSAENEPAQRLTIRSGYKFAGEIMLHFRPGLRVFCYEKSLAPFEAPPDAPDAGDTAQAQRDPA